MSQELEVLLFDPNKIEVFNPLKAQLATLEKESNSLVFDYRDKHENKAARSHVATLRKVKTRITQAKSEAKAGAIAFGKALDAEANELLDRMEQIIGKHADEIKRIENEEKAVVAQNEALIKSFFEWEGLPLDTPSSTYERYRSKLLQVELPDADSEFYKLVIDAHNSSTNQLSAVIIKAKQDEANAAELQELREKQRKADEEAAEQKRINDVKEEQARLETAAREKAEKEQADKLAKEKRDKELAEQRAIDLEIEAQQAAKDKIEAQKLAEQKAEQARLDGIAEQQRKQKELDDQMMASKKKREDSIENQRKVSSEALEAITAQTDISEETAKHLIKLVAHGKISHFQINY